MQGRAANEYARISESQNDNAGVRIDFCNFCISCSRYANVVFTCIWSDELEQSELIETFASTEAVLSGE